jgi:hypothetical protein
MWLALSEVSAIAVADRTANHNRAQTEFNPERARSRALRQPEAQTAGAQLGSEKKPMGDFPE